MIKKNILGLLFLLSALCLFNSCEDDPYYDDYGWATDALCNNTWVDFYTNNKGYECEQRLDFYNDHTGEDFTGDIQSGYLANPIILSGTNMPATADALKVMFGDKEGKSLNIRMVVCR